MKLVRTAHKAISPSFLGLVATPYKAQELRGPYRLSNKIMGSLSLKPVKDPQNVSVLVATLCGTLWGKTASLKKEGDTAFRAVLRSR